MVKLLNPNSDRILWSGETVSEKKSSIQPRLMIFTFILFLLIGGCLFYVWSRIEVIETGYKISHELAKGKKLAENNKKLKLEIAMLKSYNRIEKIAVEELKMIKANPHQVIIIR